MRLVCGFDVLLCFIVVLDLICCRLPYVCYIVVACFCCAVLLFSGYDCLWIVWCCCVGSLIVMPRTKICADVYYYELIVIGVDLLV